MALIERNMNIPRKTPPAQKTPTTSSKTPTTQSKLPRRIPTPNSTPTVAKWNSNNTDRVPFAGKTTGETRRLSGQKDVTGAADSRKTPQNVHALDKPLPGEKPLPPRPIVRLSNALSPGKDSRCLIDAREEPLRMTSHAGEMQHWPSLTPQSATSTSTPASTDFASAEPLGGSPPSSPSHATRASLLTAATTLTNVITGRSSTKEQRNLTGSQSSTSSYASANESSSPALPDIDTTLEIKKIRDNDASSSNESVKATTQSMNFPARQASLRKRISEGSLVSPPGGSSRKLIAFTDFTRARNASATSIESRPHSPSPASFSRPRPGSLTHTDSKAIETASRIPVPDTKKAKVVDVKKNRFSGSSATSSALAPTFGSRRLASPEALKILENGKMRRQLKRMAPEASVAGARIERAWTPDSNSTACTNEMPSLSHSMNSSPVCTLAPNSPETGPNDSSFHDLPELPGTHGGLSYQETQYGSADTEEEKYPDPQNECSVEDDEFDVPNPVRLPPTTNPFAIPLQTIPSQAVLPTGNAFNDGGPNTELTRTLSRLEGNGSPPKTDVDQQTLLHMFGHLKRGLSRNTQASATLSENVAVAEKYLAQHPSDSMKVNEEGKNTDIASENRRSNATLPKDKIESLCKDKQNQTMISKWSDSTPSNKDLSPAADGLCFDPIQSSTQSRQSKTSSKEFSVDNLSIGYPSRIPGRTSTTVAPVEDRQSVGEGAKTRCASRRRSSPTLGKDAKPNNQKGSVRAAREGIHVANASFTRTTLSAESKKSTRMPKQATKTFSIPEKPSRGRPSDSQKQRSRHMNRVPPETPRSRSKSRYVLDKINDLFSGKRDRKSQVVPPVPRLEKNDLDTYAPLGSNPVELATNGNPTKAPRLPKMPSISPSTQAAMRSTSPTTTRTDDTVAIDSFSDAQSVQNLSEHVIGKAQREKDPQRKERLLNFAKVLNDSLISAREAQISAETAQHAAKHAQMSYEMTQQSLAMLQRLAATMTRARTNRPS